MSISCRFSFSTVSGSVAQIGSQTDLRYPRTDSSNGFSDGDPEGHEADKDGNADLELCDLTVEFRRHEELAQRFHKEYLRLDAAPTVTRGVARNHRVHW